MRKLIAANVWLSRQFDRLFAPGLRVDGNSDFVRHFAPSYLMSNAVVYDIGGGKQPYLGFHRLNDMECSVVGLDISASELVDAPDGAYARTVVADICHFCGEADADLVICQTLLEHVPDTAAAIRAMSSIVKPGGRVLIFAPCRNAPFARLNLVLGERLKRRILFAIFPHTARAQGFTAYYDRCVPSKVVAVAAECGLQCVALRAYSMSSYFSFCFPLYAIWRIWTGLVRALGWTDLCETFAVAFEKPRQA